MVDSILDIKGKEKVIVRMSVNPEEIVKKVEIKTSPLLKRIEAINKLEAAGYKVGVLIAPVILIDNYKEKYEDLVKTLYLKLSDSVKEKVFFEIIFMTYSFVHDKINSEVFTNGFKIYEKEKMTVRGKGKYTYKSTLKTEATIYFQNLLNIYFPNNKIIYIV